MPCQRVRIGDSTAFVCGRGPAPRPRRCAAEDVRRVRCGQPAEFLCDNPRSGGKTCDAPLCAAHAHVIGEDRHLCPRHVHAIEDLFGGES